MKHPNNLRLTRRQWLLATTAALTGCGGGGGNLAGALPGTGGTGIGVQGPITGFGSVIVNKTKFDDSTASVYMDDVRVSSLDLRVGMVANINGSLDASGVGGSASRIDVWSIASGVVSAVDHTRSTFSMFSKVGVIGTIFSTDVATSFEDLVDITAISVGTPLTVWGVQTSANASTWRATRVKLLGQQPLTTVSTGLFNANTKMLNDMQLRDLSGTYMNGLGDQLLRVEGDFDAGTNVLDVKSKPIAVTTAQLFASSGLIEIEGVVTANPIGTDFYIGMIHVDASGPGTSGVSSGSLVEVTGSMQGGKLIATKVEIENSHSAVQIDITGVVDTYTSLSDFVVRGQKCDASNPLLKVVSGQLSNLQRRTKVRVIGSSEGHETLKVESIEIGVPWSPEMFSR
jgi:hypothetical protein